MGEMDVMERTVAEDEEALAGLREEEVALVLLVLGDQRVLGALA